MIDLENILFGNDHENKEWFSEQYKKCLVDLNKTPEKPKPVISIGKHLYKGIYYHNPIMTAGEMSAISAPSKSYKTYIKSHFASAFLMNDCDFFLDDIRGHREDNDCLIDLDTEQGKFWSWNTFNRTKKLSKDINSDFYYPFRLRHLNPLDRCRFIDELLKSNIIKSKPKLIFIDGIADLIPDSNDLVMSNEIAEKVMTWTDVYNIHVSVIIHNAFGTTKATGHLGSAVIKKAETIINLIPEVEKDLNGNETKTGIVTANHMYSRGKPFQNFKFKRHNTEDRLELVDDFKTF